MPNYHSTLLYNLPLERVLLLFTLAGDREEGVSKGKASAQGMLALPLRAGVLGLLECSWSNVANSVAFRRSPAEARDGRFTGDGGGLLAAEIDNEHNIASLLATQC